MHGLQHIKWAAVFLLFALVSHDGFSFGEIGRGLGEVSGRASPGSVAAWGCQWSSGKWAVGITQESLYGMREFRAQQVALAFKVGPLQVGGSASRFGPSWYQESRFVLGVAGPLMKLAGRPMMSRVHVEKRDQNALDFSRARSWGGFGFALPLAVNTTAPCPWLEMGWRIPFDMGSVGGHWFEGRQAFRLPFFKGLTLMWEEERRSGARLRVWSFSGGGERTLWSVGILEGRGYQASFQMGWRGLRISCLFRWHPVLPLSTGGSVEWMEEV